MMPAPDDRWTNTPADAAAFERHYGSDERDRPDPSEYADGNEAEAMPECWCSGQNGCVGHAGVSVPVEPSGPFGGAYCAGCQHTPECQAGKCAVEAAYPEVSGPVEPPAPTEQGELRRAIARMRDEYERYAAAQVTDLTTRVLCRAFARKLDALLTGDFDG